MKETKFRVWDIEAKKMRYIITDLHWALHGLVGCKWMDSETTDIHTLVNDADCVGGKDRFILMQYIGHKDKKDVEVCEGDELDGGYGSTCGGEVFWDEEGSSFRERNYHAESLGIYDTSGRKITGNIHSNSEIRGEK